MLALYKEEGRTPLEAKERLLENTNLNIDDLITVTEEVEGKLFKSKKYIISAIKKDDIKDKIRKYLEDLASKMNLEVKMEIKEEDNIFNVLLVCDNNAILIGKEGRTINAIQLLLRQYINSDGLFNIKVNLDVSNYKAKKVKNIEYEIKKIAKEVLKTKLEAKLDPMNSYERRVVHTVISNYEDLETESIGEEPNRYVVIRFKED